MTTPARIEIVLPGEAVMDEYGELPESDQAFCPACEMLLATITPRVARTKVPGVHGVTVIGRGVKRVLPERDVFARSVIGFHVTLAPGFVNRGVKHPSGGGWFHRAPADLLYLDRPSPPVRLPCVLTCKCGEEVSLEAPFDGFDTYFRENATDKSRPRGKP